METANDTLAYLERRLTQGLVTPEEAAEVRTRIEAIEGEHATLRKLHEEPATPIIQIYMIDGRFRRHVLPPAHVERLVTWAGILGMSPLTRVEGGGRFPMPLRSLPASGPTFGVPKLPDPPAEVRWIEVLGSYPGTTEPVLTHAWHLFLTPPGGHAKEITFYDTGRIFDHGTKIEQAARQDDHDQRERARRLDEVEREWGPYRRMLSELAVANWSREQARRDAAETDHRWRELVTELYEHRWEVDLTLDDLCRIASIHGGREPLPADELHEIVRAFRAETEVSR